MGNYRDKFSKEEWNKIIASPIWMFQAIAGADGRIDIEELDALSRIKLRADRFESELAKDVISSLQFDAKEIASKDNFDMDQIRCGLREVAGILADKVEEKTSLRFKKILIAIGRYIAGASGDLMSFKISNEESQTLTELSLYLKISKTDLRKNPTIQDLMMIMAEGIADG